MAKAREAAREFLTWWGSQLRDCVPASLRRGSADLADIWSLRLIGAGPEGGQVALSDRRGERATELGRFGLDAAGLAAIRRMIGRSARRKPVVLELGPGHVLEKTLSLPMAAERDLDRVLALEMDHETPFTSDEVFWTAAIAGRDRERNRLDVRLSLIPRQGIAESVGRLRAAGLGPVGLIAPAPDGAGARAIMLDRGARFAPARPAGPVLALGALCVVLALAACAIPFARQARQLAVLDSRIAALRPAIDEADLLRQRIAGSGEALIAGERLRIGDRLEILALTTAALPDDSYLTDLTLTGRKLSLTGQSASAARLLAALAANPAYGDVAFAAPVTRLEGTDREAFSIDAEIR